MSIPGDRGALACQFCPMLDPFRGENTKKHKNPRESLTPIHSLRLPPISYVSIISLLTLGITLLTGTIKQLSNNIYYILYYMNIYRVIELHRVNDFLNP